MANLNLRDGITKETKGQIETAIEEAMALLDWQCNLKAIDH